MGYSSENAIPTHFQRVPPWPDGLYELFAAIVIEMWSCPGNATSVYACMKEGSPIQVYMHARERSLFAAVGEGTHYIAGLYMSTRFMYEAGYM